MIAPQRLLLIFCHPALERSRVNIRLIESIREIPNLTFHDLYEKYPHFDIDIPKEQRLLQENDIIVLHHPFYWYSCPPLLKQWLDLVFEHGFAYGAKGSALKGKFLFNAITAGGPQEAYSQHGNNRFTVKQFLAPFDQTAYLCGMHYLAPFVVHGSLRFSDAEAVSQWGEKYRRLLQGLIQGNWDKEKFLGMENLAEAF